MTAPNAICMKLACFVSSSTCSGLRKPVQVKHSPQPHFVFSFFLYMCVPVGSLSTARRLLFSFDRDVLRTVPVCTAGSSPRSADGQSHSAALHP
jgi:hypothetical protein